MVGFEVIVQTPWLRAFRFVANRQRQHVVCGTLRSIRLLARPRLLLRSSDPRLADKHRMTALV